MNHRSHVAAIVFMALIASLSSAQPPATKDWNPAALLRAVQQEKTEDVREALAAGVDVNSTNDYGATPLFFACDRGNEEIVKMLLEAGADPSVRDNFYQASPLTWAMQNGNKSIAVMLMAKDTATAGSQLINAIESGDEDFARQILEAVELTEPVLVKARDAALRKAKDEEYEGLAKLFDELELPEPVPLEQLTQEAMQQYAGNYKSENFTVAVAVVDDELKLGFNDNSKSTLEHVGVHEFMMGASNVRFEMEDQQVRKLVLNFGGREFALEPASDATAEEMTANTSEDASAAKVAAEPEQEKEPKFGPSSKESIAADRAISSVNWPQFRGNAARGVAEGQQPPIEWNVKENVALKWKTDIEGLGLSSPTVWGDRVFLTTATSQESDNSLRTGLFGDVEPITEDYEFDFDVYCIDKQSGEVRWKKTATRGRPQVKRHTKSSHANSTIATDGTHVIAFFGAEGLYCYSMDGTLIWKKDLGLLDSGWFYDPAYQWGFGSSPIIFEGHVIIQCDIQEESFIASYEITTGTQAWRVDRDEIPSWSTPTVHVFGDQAMLLTNATHAARGYDARTGELLWSMPENSEIVVPTPFVAHGLIFVASGYAPIQPIYAIRPEARGDLGASDGEDASDDSSDDVAADDDAEANGAVAWSTRRGGPYMPTPIVYGDYLYTCGNSGILTCRLARTGERVYRKRMSAEGGTLSFTASPLAADGHLYLASEDGRVLVVKAGPEYELVATNTCDEDILATPAISDGMVLLRTSKSLIAVGD